MEPTGRREAPPDDRLRAIRVSQRARRNGVVRIAAAIAIPDFAPLHPGYASWNIVRWIEPLACAGRHGCEFPIQLSYSERMCVRILAARCARALRRLPPSIRRGRRESRVRAAPAVSCANMHKKTHTSIQVQRRHPGLPCAMVYGLFRALPGDRAFLPPSSLRNLFLKNLTPASGCQDHTASPSAPVTLVSRNFRVHRIPPHVRDDREPPLSSGETGEVKSVICPTAKAKYFRAKGWTGFG